MKVSGSKILNAVSIALRALLFIWSLFAFQHTRYGIMVLFIVFLIADSVRSIIKKRFLWQAFLCNLVAIIFVGAIMFTFHTTLEQLRFSVNEERYYTAAVSLINRLSVADDTSWGELPLDNEYALSCNNDLIYVKHGKSIMLYFPTWTSFSRSSGFLYFSDETAHDFLEHPNHYDSRLIAEKAYDLKVKLSSDWAYSILY